MRRPSQISGGLLGLTVWAVRGVFRRSRGLARSAARRITEAASNVRRRRLDRRADARWARTLHRFLAGDFDLELLLGTASDSDLPVIMCLWNRPSRIDAILAELDAQDSPRGIRLMLWNNAAADDSHYRDRIAGFTPRGALRSVEYVSSDVNIGGLARFLLARTILCSSTASGQFVMLDDDQVVTSAFLRDLLAASGPRRIAGVWAWRRLDRTHGNRLPVRPGEPADYVGTGGCVCDLELVAHATFFTELPRRYAFLEDQWMCAYARSRGWELTKVDTPFEFVLAEQNQYLALGNLKDEFWEYLERWSSRQHVAR
jgi:hypothetical protein